MCAVLFYCVVFLLMSRAVKGISSRRGRWKGTFHAGLLNNQPWIFPMLNAVGKRGSVE